MAEAFATLLNQLEEEAPAPKRWASDREKARQSEQTRITHNGGVSTRSHRDTGQNSTLRDIWPTNNR